MSGLLKQLVFKPLQRGLLIGGIPFALVFSTLAGEVVSATTFGYTIILTPVAIGLTSWIAMRGDTLSRGSIFIRALFSALGACVSLPTIVCAVLVFHDLGAEGFSNPKNVPVFAFLFTVWAGVTALFGSFVALVYLFVKNHRRQPQPRT